MGEAPRKNDAGTPKAARLICSSVSATWALMLGMSSLSERKRAARTCRSACVLSSMPRLYFKPRSSASPSERSMTPEVGVPTGVPPAKGLCGPSAAGIAGAEGPPNVLCAPASAPELTCPAAATQQHKTIRNSREALPQRCTPSLRKREHQRSLARVTAGNATLKISPVPRSLTFLPLRRKLLWGAWGMHNVDPLWADQSAPNGGMFEYI